MRAICLIFLELRLAFWGWMSLRARRFSTRFFNFCIKRAIHIYGRMLDKYKDLLLKHMDRERLEKLVNSMDVVLSYYYTNVLGLGKENCDGNH